MECAMREGREQKIQRFLNEDINTETPLDELLYGERIIPPAMQPPPAPESPALTEILTHLDGIRTLMEKRDAESMKEFSEQSTLDKLTGSSADSRTEDD